MTLNSKKSSLATHFGLKIFFGAKISDLVTNYYKKNYISFNITLTKLLFVPDLLTKPPIKAFKQKSLKILELKISQTLGISCNPGIWRQKTEKFVCLNALISLTLKINRYLQYNNSKKIY